MQTPLLLFGLAQAKCDTAKIVPPTAGTTSGVTSQIHDNQPGRHRLRDRVGAFFRAGRPLLTRGRCEGTALTTRKLVPTFRPRRRS
jgi:hypothetical protein